MAEVLVAMPAALCQMPCVAESVATGVGSGVGVGVGAGSLLPPPQAASSMVSSKVLAQARGAGALQGRARGARWVCINIESNKLLALYG
jgi:hypothetical protein